MASIHTIQLPRRVVIGNDVLGMSGKICEDLGFHQKTLVITGPNTYGVAGKEVMDSLIDSGFEADYLIVKEATAESVKRVEEKVRETDPNVMLGVGGGKAIDITKYVSAKKNIPFISVPTSASHDGISSPRAVIKDLEGPVSVDAQTPTAILVDIRVVSNSPYRLTASGCGDILAKFTATADWLLAHNLKNEYYGDYAANLALMSAKLVAKNSALIREGSAEGVKIVAEALISCGVAMSIAGSSRPCSGSEHLFAHALDSIAPNRALHGERCGVGAIMMARLHGMNWKEIRDALERIGAPTTAEGLNVTPEQIVEALVTAQGIRPERYTILARGMNSEVAQKLERETGVI